MDLKRYIDNQYLVKCSASQDEIRELFRIVERDLRLAEKLKDENDWQFAIAYNSVLQLAKMLKKAVISWLKKHHPQFNR